MPSALLPGTEVLARSLRWEVVTVESLGPQTMYRLRGLEGSVAGRELDLLHPFERIEPGFVAIAKGFVERHRGALEAEQSRNREWIQQRVNEITGDRVGVPVQPGLFDQPRSATESPKPNWTSSPDPVERLAGFAGDRARPPALRSEADGALRIYRQRIEALDGRLALSPPEIVPLGLLMLAPEARA